MFKAVKALSLFTRYLKRIALALEDISRLYEEELRNQGIYRRPQKPIKDTVEVSYGYNPVKEDMTLDRDWM